ncbi:UNVERIFIED_ORG: filamentous hemagglutinin [Enterobacter sp. JUb101]|nr:filamentous hemagglutinin [Lelliottia amnigena]
MRGGWREYQSDDRVSGGGIAQNSLDTGTLGFSDLQNEADYKVSHTGISLSSSKPSGGDFSMGGMISAASHSGHAEGTTQAAVANGTITVRDTANQKQDVANLSRDTENANDSISPIFDKEKEQNRLKTVGLISDIGSQAADIAKTQGDIYALEAAKKEVPALKENATDKEREQYVKDLRSSPAYQKEMANFGTGSTLQRGIQSVTAALQGLAGGNIAGALAGASAPELANIIGHHMGIDDDPATKAVAHAILGGAVAALQGNNAMAGAAGAAVGEVIASQLYPNVPKDKLTEDQKQTISTLASISAGIAGGLAGDSTLSAAAGSQAGKNAVENNALGPNSFGKGMADMGLSQQSLAASMIQNGATADELTEALIKNSQGQIPEGQDAVKGLLTAWGEFFGVPVSALTANGEMTPQQAAEILASGVPTSEAKLIQYVAAKAFLSVAKSSDLGLSPANQKYVDILSPEAKQHILYGDSTTQGGHLYPGNPGKTVFPQSWSADKVVHTVGDIATSPDTKWFAQTGTGGTYTNAGRPARWVAWEEREGVRVRVVYEPASGKIVTAFPDNNPTPPALKPIKK